MVSCLLCQPVPGPTKSDKDMKRRLDSNDPPRTGPLHESLIRILPQKERETLIQQRDPACGADSPAVKLSACREIKHVITPSTKDQHDRWRYDDELGALVAIKRNPGADSSICLICAVLVGKLTSTSRGLLVITDGEADVPVIVAPSPLPSMRSCFIYATNWRYIPACEKTLGYFEVLSNDIVQLSPIRKQYFKRSSKPELNGSEEINLHARVTARSCMIATRKKSCCFLVELCGQSEATVVVFRDEAIVWWPFIQIGIEISIRGLRLCSLPSYSRRTVFSASDSVVFVTEVFGNNRLAGNGSTRLEKRKKALQRNPHSSVYDPVPVKDALVDYEGVITATLPDGRFMLDDRIVFHPGPIHSFGFQMNISTNFREGTKVKVFNAHLVQRDCDIRLFPSAKSSMELLYFGELSTIHSLSDASNWRHSKWNRLWKQLDREDVFWAEDMYDMLARKFWKWLRGSTQQARVATDCDRISCLLGDQKEVGMVQYVMYLLSGRNELLQQGGYSRRDVYKEFLDPPALCRDESQASLARIPSLKRLKEIALASQVNGGHIRINGAHTTQATLNITNSFTAQSDVVIFHHSEILENLKCLSQTRMKGTVSKLRLVLSGLLHTTGVVRDCVALSDSTQTLPVRIIGLLEPALIGAVVLVTDYYVVFDFRSGDHESVTVLFSAGSVKTVVDGPYTEMGISSTSGPLICETQTCDQAKRTGEMQSSRQNGPLGGSFVLTRRTLSAGAKNSQDAMLRFADVPVVCLFVETLRFREDRVELGGKLVAIRSSQRIEAWHVVLQNEQTINFWDCKILLSGDIAMEFTPVFRENRLWSISCTELNGEPEAESYIRRKGSSDSESIVVLSSNFTSMVPWVEDLGKGEYMRYGRGECFSNQCSYEKGNFSEMSEEGAQYSLVRDAVERFSACAAERLTSDTWKLYNGSNNPGKDIVHIRGLVVQHSVWNNGSRVSNHRTEWILTIREESMGIFDLAIDFRERLDCLTGVAPGMVIVVYNIIRVHGASWTRFHFKAGEDTIVRPIRIVEKDSFGCMCDTLPRVAHYELLKHLPRLDLVELEDINSEKWTGILRFDVMEVVEVFLRTRPLHNRQRCERCAVKKRPEEVMVEMRVIARVEDGTTRALMQSEGFGKCCRLLGLSNKESRDIKQVAAEHGEVALDSQNAQEHGLDCLFKLNCCGRTGVVVGIDRVVGEDVIVKCFNLGFGKKVWTACREELCSVECVALVDDGVEWLRARVSALEDGLVG